jgi:O-antigen biosynthesis protein
MSGAEGAPPNTQEPGPIAMVTVTVATKNREDTIGDAIESLLKLDFPKDRYEVIVVDDGSTDKTPEIAKSFVSDTAPLVRYIRQDYAGLSVARNRGITEGRGDLFCFMDDDAVAEPDWLTGMVDTADRHPDVECFGGRIVLRLEGHAPKTCEQESLGATLDLGPNEQIVDRIKGANMGMRRSAFERNGMFNPALVWRGDEDDWVGRLQAIGGKVMYVPTGLVWHRRTKSDLRLLNLLRTRFGWGVGQVQLRRESGMPLKPRSELRQLRRGLRHFYRDRCTGGLLVAAIKVGALWGNYSGEIRKQRQSAPKLEATDQP